MRNLKFFCLHALRDFRANGRRSFFAILCIAAGVAASVALAIISQSMLHTLVHGSRETIGGDVRVQAPQPGEVPEKLVVDLREKKILDTYESGFGYVEHGLSENGVNAIREIIDHSFPGALADSSAELLPVDPRRMQVKTLTKGTQVYGPTLFVIDRKKYPFYRTIRTRDGLTLADALQAPYSLVINEKLAEKLRVEIGDKVRLTGSKQSFLIAGMVEDLDEADSTTPQLASQGFIYLDQASSSCFDRKASISVLNLKLNDNAPVAAISAALSEAYPALKVTDRLQVVAGNEELNRLMAGAAAIMGLLAVLVGGIGIANTMQVVVQRRKTEIAVLKTIGVNGRGIVMMFVVQAAGMGLIGGLVGTILGYGIAYCLQSIVSGFLETELILVYGLVPALLGLFLGLIVSVTFGLLPALVAAGVRPIAVLRAQSDTNDKLGWRNLIASVLVMVVLMVVTCLPVFGGIFASIVAVLAGGVIVVLLMAILWASLSVLTPIAAKLVPVEVKVSLQSMMARKGRAIATCVALSLGIFMLGTVLLLATSLIKLVQTSARTAMGGTANVMLTNRAAVDEQVAWLRSGELPGYQGHFLNRHYQVVTKWIETEEGKFTLEDFRRQRERIIGNGKMARLGIAIGEQLAAVELTKRIVESPMQMGSSLSAGDRLQKKLVLQHSPEVLDSGLKPGDKITYAFGGPFGEEVTFIIAGIARPAEVQFNGMPMVPFDAVPESIRPVTWRLTVDIAGDDAQLLKDRLGKLPGAAIFDLNEINRTLISLLKQLAVLPFVIGSICLIVAIVVSGNSVALSTMERDDEIAILKTIGLQRERVLGLLIGESIFLGLVSGSIGVLLSYGFLWVAMTSAQAVAGQQQTMALALPVGSFTLLLILCPLVAGVAAIAAAWTASAQKPGVLLRQT